MHMKPQSEDIALDAIDLITTCHLFIPLSVALSLAPASNATSNSVPRGELTSKHNNLALQVAKFTSIRIK